MPKPRSNPAQPTDGAAAAPGRTGPTDSKTPSLDQFTSNLTELARKKKIDPVLGRDAEVRQIIDILTRRRQNNPILTGEAGVGKTAVVEGFALRIAAGDVPDALKNVQLRTLDLGLLQAGAGVKGEFENRLRSVIDEVKASPTPIILFIDEAHTLIGAGAPRGRAMPRICSSRPWRAASYARSRPPPGPNTRNISRRTRRSPGGFRSSKSKSRPRPRRSK